MKPLFPYAGGKSKVAKAIWAAFGDVGNYVEPFFGGGAVLLARPHEPAIETINDKDGFVSNFYRAAKADSAALARAANWPLNENDLHARHAWLVKARRELTARLEGDPEFYDAQIAGWWLWGICSWIGGGWCSGTGPWRSIGGRLVKIEGEKNGTKRSLPRISRVGMEGRRPDLGGRGRGVGIHSSCDRAAFKNLSALADRLRYVRVCCGDWTRIISRSVTTEHGMTGMFLDPPYSRELRDPDIYATDSAGNNPAGECGRWCGENGENPLLRIALCGYDGEHNHLEAQGWRVYAWKANGGYSNRGNGRGKKNRNLERIWFSPGCLSDTASIEQMPLWKQQGGIEA